MEKMVILIMATAVGLGGCSGMSNTEQRVVERRRYRGRQRRPHRLGGGLSRLRRRHRGRGRHGGRLCLRPI